MNEGLDSFISFCDAMMIVEEGFLTNIKNTIKKGILNLINRIQTKMKQKKETRFRTMMISFLDRLKRLLGDVDNAQTENEINDIQEEVNEISKEVESMELNTDWNPTKDKRWKKCPDYLKGIILSGDVMKARNYILDTLQKMIMTKRDNLTSEILNKYRSDIGCIRYFYKDRIYTSKGKIRSCRVACDEEAYRNLVGLCRLVSEDFTEGNLLSVVCQMKDYSESLTRKESGYESDNYNDDLY